MVELSMVMSLRGWNPWTYSSVTENSQKGRMGSWHSYICFSMHSTGQPQPSKVCSLGLLWQHAGSQVTNGELQLNELLAV